MAHTLRKYQNEALVSIWNEINKEQTALCVLSTGSGKSVIIYELLRKSIAAKPDIKCLVLFNRVTLLSQLANRFKSALGEDRVGVYCGTEGQWDLSRPVTVGSIQSLDPDHLNFNLIIIDECHNLGQSEDAESAGRYERFVKHQLEQNPRTRVVGFTATDFRFDGYIHGKNKFWNEPCYKRGLRYFIDQKYLVPPIAKQPDHQIDISKLRVLRGEYRQDDIDTQTMNEAMAHDQVVDALNRTHGRNKIVWFCSSINHAELIKKILTEKGEHAVTLHSKMAWDDRDESQDVFENGSARHLTFVSVVSEGYDYPPIDCIVLMRPTKSPGLMVQTVGRGLRPYGEKEDCLVLDYANVISTLGPLEDPVVAKKRKGKGEQPPSQKACPQCRTYVAPRVMCCPDCGFNWPKAEATKIMMTPDEEASFLAKHLHQMETSDVRMKLHQSKNGNRCIKIVYHPVNFIAPTLEEYFAVDTAWGYRRFQIRAIEMNIVLRENIEDQVQENIGRKPARIEYVFENKYPRIKRVIFEGA